MRQKIFLLFIAMGILFTNGFAQTWLNNLPTTKSKAELTLFDYQDAFETYWQPYNVKYGKYQENGITKKAIGWKQFKRWEWMMESQVDPSTGILPTNTAFEIYNKSVQENLLRSANEINSNQWSSLGPNNSSGGYSGIGRVSCIAFHPTDNNTYWIGAPAGGLWKTIDNGSSWTCLTDENNVLGVSSIIIPSNYATSKTIYIGTGDRDAWDNRSIGVLKSTNGGSTWSATGLSYSLQDGEMVNKMIIDPNNNDIIIAATSDGVYKTTNAGVNWSTISTRAFIDLEYKPGNFSTIYGATKSGSIYTSTNTGSTWSQKLSSSGYRVEIAVTPANSSIVYAIVASSNNGLYGIYKSTNSGTSFSSIYSSPNLMGWYSDGSDGGGQAYYDLCIDVSPTDANKVIVGGVITHRSTNGGTSWSCSNCWTGYDAYNLGNHPVVHADKHNLTYRSNGDLFECNDGGVYISTNDGSSWTDKSDGLVISQMYKLGVSQTSSTETITGLQDNGTKLLNNSSWYDVKGGDGMECLIDYTDNQIQYGTYVNGQITRTTNQWNSSTDIEPAAAGDGAWVTPYIIHPTSHNTLFAGYADVWKTTNKGDSWTKISTMSTGDKIRSMAISKSNPSILYVADNSTIWKTSNQNTWSNVTNNLPVSTSNITYICIDKDDPAKVWVSLSGYNSNVVYYTSNSGSSWTDISAGLPNIPAYSIVQDESNAATVLYVGTELGVYVKEDSNNWLEYNTGMPKVRIGEIEIYYDNNSANNKLRAASYGRGLWEVDLFVAGPPLASVSTDDASNVSTNSATVGGNVTADGGSTVTERGIVWGTSSYPTTNGDKLQIGLGTGAFTNSLTGLNISTTYYIRAYAITTNGTAYGSNKSFTTITPLPPTVNTDIPTNVNVSSATVGGNVSADGGNVVTERGIVYALSIYPTTSDIKLPLGTGLGAFTTNLTALNASTTYYVRAYAINVNGTSYGNNKYFTTPASLEARFSASPLSACLNQAVTFVDESTGNPTSWLWDFGDGTSSILQNPQHAYAGTGTYNVVLTITLNGASDTEVKNGYITVNNTATEANTVSASSSIVCTGASVVLNYSGGVGETFEWYTESCGGTSVGTGNPSVSPTENTTYFGRWESDCGNSSCLPLDVTVKEKPMPSFVSDDSGEPIINFTNTSLNADSYLWDLGDDSPNETTVNVSHEYQNGVYDVILYATNNCGTDSSKQELAVDYDAIILLNEGTIKIFPNPTEGMLHISLPINNVTIKLISLDGKILRTIKTNEQKEIEMNLENYSKGIYNLVIVTQEKEEKTIKIIKK